GGGPNPRAPVSRAHSRAHPGRASEGRKRGAPAGSRGREGGARGATGAALKIGTWNVNGIRAREAQVQAWIERDRPDVVCLQEIKASPEQVPAMLCEMEGYWCYWHGVKGYSGVALQVKKETFPERPQFLHPEFDYENRIVTARLADLTVASVYVPN